MLSLLFPLSLYLNLFLFLLCTLVFESDFFPFQSNISKLHADTHCFYTHLSISDEHI